MRCPPTRNGCSDQISLRYGVCSGYHLLIRFVAKGAAARMNGLIRFSLNNWYAVVVFVLTVLVLGVLTLTQVPQDILPANRSPAVQVLTFYGGMPAAAVEKDLSNRMERWTGQAAGTANQESRSI